MQLLYKSDKIPNIITLSVVKRNNLSISIISPINKTITNTVINKFNT